MSNYVRSFLQAQAATMIDQIKEFNVWTKAGCAHGRTYDVDFCSRVCELGQNQVCSPITGPGVDVCATGTRCIKNVTGEYRCQADKQAREGTSLKKEFYFISGLQIRLLVLLFK